MLPWIPLLSLASSSLVDWPAMRLTLLVLLASLLSARPARGRALRQALRDPAAAVAGRLAPER